MSNQDLVRALHHGSIDPAGGGHLAIELVRFKPFKPQIRNPSGKLLVKINFRIDFLYK